MTRDTFLQTIADKPGEDGPRLVYADWCEEQREADRAEFVRTQVEMFSLTCSRLRCINRRQVRDKCNTCRKRLNLRARVMVLARPEFAGDVVPGLIGEMIAPVATPIVAAFNSTAEWSAAPIAATAPLVDWLDATLAGPLAEAMEQQAAEALGLVRPPPAPRTTP
jgi:uncharacterized protein (TIGR02996 family)